MPEVSRKFKCPNCGNISYEIFGDEDKIKMHDEPQHCTECMGKYKVHIIVSENSNTLIEITDKNEKIETPLTNLKLIARIKNASDSEPIKSKV